MQFFLRLIPTASMNFNNIFVHFHWKGGGIIPMETSCKRTTILTPVCQRQVLVRNQWFYTTTEVKQQHNFFFMTTLWQLTCSPLQSPCSLLHSAANGPSIYVNNAKVWDTVLCHGKLVVAQHAVLWKLRVSAVKIHQNHLSPPLKNLTG